MRVLAVLQAGLQEAIAGKDAELRAVRQRVAEAVQAWGEVPRALTVTALGCASRPGLGLGRNEGQEPLLTGGGEGGAAAAAEAEVPNGGNCVELVLHQASLEGAARGPAARTGVLLLLQLAAPGAAHPFRKLLHFPESPHRPSMSAGGGPAAPAGGGAGGGERLALDTLLRLEGADEVGEGGQGGGERVPAGQGGREQRLLELLCGVAQLSVHDMQRSLLGGFK